ncbi:MAG: hypothetical protein PHV23_01920 [Candidatus Gracilibacteria bacterium]|nr:hypothetical protein [Candidatus Gracilibacteria bacterium]
MLKSFIKSYYKLLDEKIENGTIMVLIIAVLITTIGDTVNNPNNTKVLSLKTSIMENNTDNDIIVINGKLYKLVD